MLFRDPSRIDFRGRVSISVISLGAKNPYNHKMRPTPRLVPAMVVLGRD